MRVGYEYQITCLDGDNCEHWDIKDTDIIIKDIKENITEYKDESYTVEVIKHFSYNSPHSPHEEWEREYYLIYPEQQNNDQLPKHIMKHVNIILEGVKA